VLEHGKTSFLGKLHGQLVLGGSEASALSIE